MSRWSRKTDAEKAEAAKKQQEHSKSKTDQIEEIRQKTFDQVIENGEIPLMCTRVMLYAGANNYTIEERKTFFSGKPIPMYIGICRACKQEHTAPLMGDPMTSMLIAQIAFNLMAKGRLVDRRKMKDEPSQARKETH